MNRDDRLKRLRFRAWHRGIKEADLLVGGYLDHYGTGWDEQQEQWFAALLEEQDVDILAWAFGTAEPPARYQGEMMQRLRKLDYIAPFPK